MRNKETTEGGVGQRKKISGGGPGDEGGRDMNNERSSFMNAG